jgi:hypothetical protein
MMEVESAAEGMSSPAPVLEVDAPSYVYSSLDFTQPSIRLIRILPDLSIEGQIRCEVRDASIADHYTCLSYVWGEPSENWITIHGQRHSVRDNLLSFLQVTRKQKSHLWFWIDALSINQLDVAERTHQVQQMGLVYSSAQGVLSWLGDDEKIAEFFSVLAIEQIGRHRVHRSLIRAWSLSPHWTRAWITQETVLAQSLTLMARSSEIAARQLPRSTDEVSSSGTELNSTFYQYKELAAATGREGDSVRGRTLPFLLALFPSKTCALVHDRIFSLLGICGEGADLQVNYSLTVEELAFKVLLKCKRSFCLCSMNAMLKALGLNSI